MDGRWIRWCLSMERWRRRRLAGEDSGWGDAMECLTTLPPYHLYLKHIAHFINFIQGYSKSSNKEISTTQRCQLIKRWNSNRHVMSSAWFWLWLHDIPQALTSKLKAWLRSNVSFKETITTWRLDRCRWWHAPLLDWATTCHG